jgi:hypothetical protein
LPNKAVGPGHDIDRADACLVAEQRQRNGIDETARTIRLPRDLDEGGQDCLAVGMGERGRQPAIVIGRRGGAQIDVERDLGRTGGEQRVEEPRMIAARPGPRTEFAQAARVDRHHYHIAAGGTLEQAKASVHQGALERLERAQGKRRADDREDRERRQPVAQHVDLFGGSRDWRADIQHQCLRPVEMGLFEPGREAVGDALCKTGSVAGSVTGATASPG